MLKSFWLVDLTTSLLRARSFSLLIISDVVDPITFHPVALNSKVLLGSFLLGVAVGST